MFSVDRKRSRTSMGRTAPQQSLEMDSRRRRAQASPRTASGMWRTEHRSCVTTMEKKTCGHCCTALMICSWLVFFFLAVGALCTQILVQWQRIGKVKEGGGDIEKTHQIKVFCIVRSAVAFSQFLQVRPVHKNGGLVAELGGIGLAERAQGLGSLFKVHELRAPPMHRVVIEARRRRSDDRILGACLSVESLLQLDISSMHDVATRPDHRGRERAHRHVHDVPQQAVVHAVCGR